MDKKYEELCLNLKGITENERHSVPNMANAAAVLWHGLENINWAGFYILQKEGYLLLVPFQGKVACIRIPRGKGVCGTALEEDKTILVKDVHLFKGHIACDSASNSEIVVPIHDKNGCVAAVLDIDSPVKERFDQSDQEGLEAFAKILEKNCDWE